MESVDISIIIINHNTCKFILNCLHSIYSETYGITFEVLVVDNASSDGSIEAIASKFPQSKLFVLKKNKGFAFANNIAAEYAVGKYILFLNPDTIILDEAIQKLYFFAEDNPEGGLYGGRTVFPDGTLNPASCFNKTTLWSLFCNSIGISRVFKRSILFNPENFGIWQYDTVREVDILSGCFLLIRKDIWVKLNGFELTFFLYGEDKDLCLRAKKLGYKMFFSPEPTIIHYLGGSSNVEYKRLIKLFRAKTLLYNRHWSIFATIIGVILLKLHIFFRMITFRILSVLQPNKGYRELSYTWFRVWKRRKYWAYNTIKNE